MHANHQLHIKFTGPNVSPTQLRELDGLAFQSATVGTGVTFVSAETQQDWLAPSNGHSTSYFINVWLSATAEKAIAFSGLIAAKLVAVGLSVGECVLDEGEPVLARGISACANPGGYPASTLDGFLE